MKTLFIVPEIRLDSAPGHFPFWAAILASIVESMSVYLFRTKKSGFSSTWTYYWIAYAISYAIFDLGVSLLFDMIKDDNLRYSINNISRLTFGLITNKIISNILADKSPFSNFSTDWIQSGAMWVLTTILYEFFLKHHIHNINHSGFNASIETCLECND